MWRFIVPELVLRHYRAIVITRPIALAASTLLLIPFFAAPPAQASSQETFTTPGLTSWTVPGGITELTVTALGGGGGGGGNSAGGAGCQVVSTFAVTPGQSIRLFIGGGGGGYGGGGAGVYGGGGADSDGGGGGGGSDGPTGSTFNSGSNGGAASTAGSSGRIVITYGSSVSPTAPATPPSWYQSAGRNAGASCDAGWSPSWAQWPNGNTGGFVCNKEIYMTTTGTWSSRSRAAATLVPLRITPTPVVLSPRGC